MRNTGDAVADQAPVTSLYLDELKLQIVSKLQREPLSFLQLIRAMDGAYPTDVLNAVRLLREDIKTSESILGRLEDVFTRVASPRYDQVAIDQQLTAGIAMPEPHPLDYDWRFTATCLAVLQGVISEVRRDRIAMLGAPSLYLHLWSSGRLSTLYDKNASLVEAFRGFGLQRLICCDLFDCSTLPREFDMVVADPPWYVEHYVAFIDAAQQLLVEGGILLLSVLPRLTRPSAAQDRKAIANIAHTKGFDLLEVRPAILSYSSPPFEISALRTEGIWQGDWRSGDLFVFKRTPRRPEQLSVDRSGAGEEWDAFSMGSMIIRVKRAKGRTGALGFRPASATGDMHLHTVSRRSPIRSNIDLWTSRNLALQITRPEYVSEVLSLNHDGMTLVDAIDHVSHKNGLDAATRDVLSDIIHTVMADIGLKHDE